MNRHRFGVFLSGSFRGRAAVSRLRETTAAQPPYAAERQAARPTQPLTARATAFRLCGALERGAFGHTERTAKKLTAASGHSASILPYNVFCSSPEPVYNWDCGAKTAPLRGLSPRPHGSRREKPLETRKAACAARPVGHSSKP